jgi:hypothetical protein
MVNKHEFRIGNFATEVGKHFCTIVELRQRQALCKFNDGTKKGFLILYEQLQPIPITEDSVKDLLGFELNEDLGDMKYYQLPDVKIGYGVSFDHDELVFYKYTSLGITPLLYNKQHFQFIHHLQNLLADLTGKEIKK